MTFALRYWRLACAVCLSLTAARPVDRETDRRVDAFVRSSAMWTHTVAFVGKVEAAWRDSICRRIVRLGAGDRA